MTSTKPGTKPVKAADKSKKPRKARINNVVILRTELVEVDRLKRFHKNPRRGDVDKIADSLKNNGQFRPLVVNLGEKTGRYNEVLAGNHTFEAAVQKLGWTKMLVSWVDVDDQAARKINLADNKTADDGSYDTGMLAELLHGLDEITGTGYNESEVEKLLKGIKIDPDPLAGVIVNEDLGLDEPKPDTTADGGIGDDNSDDSNDDLNPVVPPSGLDDNDDAPTDTIADFEDEIEEEPDPNSPGVEDAHEDLPGMFSLKDPSTLKFPGLGWYGIPELDTTKFMRFEEIPPNLRTWAGYASKPPYMAAPEVDDWWLLNWGSERSKGIADLSKVMVAFYAHDDNFNMWWDYTDELMAKVLNSGIKFALTPNFSMIGGDPAAVHLWALYRSRWVGRYMQEGGLRVIPDVNWPKDNIEFLEKHVAPTLPKNLPCISVQIQNMDPKNKRWMSKMRDGYLVMLDLLEPQGVFVYGGKPGFDFWDALGYDGKVFKCENRLAIIGRTRQIKPREHQNTI